VNKYINPSQHLARRIEEGGQCDPVANVARLGMSLHPGCRNLGLGQAKWLLIPGADRDIGSLLSQPERYRATDPSTPAEYDAIGAL
jgi:hypothetical protein